MSPDTVYDSGTVTINNIFNWQYDALFGTYGAYGSQQTGANEPKLSPASPLRWLYLRFATNLTTLSRAAINQPKDNSIATCRQECGSNSPWCLRLAIGGTEQTGLLQLQAVGLSNPAVVKKADRAGPANLHRAISGVSA